MIGNMSIGSEARRIRKSQYKTLQDIQDITKLSKSTISAFERGKSNFTTDTIQKIAKALGVSVEELMK